MSVIVTGASGKLGRLVAERLMERVAPAELILVSRHPEALREFSARGVDVRYGDFNEPGSLATAFAGGHRMLLINFVNGVMHLSQGLRQGSLIVRREIGFIH